jgi:hypothetical protein
MTLLTAYTIVHVLISLVALFTGWVVVAGLLRGRHIPGWTSWFLIASATTSVTGFFFPATRLMPSHILGILTLLASCPAMYALYSRSLAGGWRKAYAICATLTAYFNTFAIVSQLFGKVPALKALAPTQTEPPFAIAELSVMILFFILGILAVKRFRETDRRGLAPVLG